ncbi:MAG: hypothetical protein JW895_07950 [Thermoleophilaceae bacterium]|nr:hypothetical protein [Thermoleophilaceae bacterium]
MSTLAHQRLELSGLRLRVWLTRRTLDHRLAAGESILSSAAHARRANQLTSPRRRRTLAKGLRRVVADAEHPRRSLSSAVPVQRGAVLHARAGIERIVARLESDDAVALAGVAQVQLMLTDAGSPIFDPHPSGDLDELVERAELALSAD